MLGRPRLAALLDQGSRRRVTLVSAPAGSGKTVACAAWAASAGRRVIWLSLDEADRAEWFWSYVWTGLKRGQCAPGDVLRTLEDCAPQRFPPALVEVAQRFAEPVVLILDDLHSVSDPAVLEGLEVLIRHAPRSLRVILSTRRPPPLQLARLRVAGELADIDGSDLACTPDEARAYFRMLGITLDGPACEALLGRTEGWMAGLRLVAMRAEAAGAGRPGRPPVPTDLVGDEPIVTDYLWDEVLAGQPPETRSFLLRTSIVPELPGDLADALTGEPGSGRTLEQLSRDNNFVVTLGTGRAGYRYHPLLRSALAAGLRREMPQEIPGLRRRAADWYAGADRPVDTIACAVAAQDWQYAAHALAEFGIDVLMTAGPEELESLLGRFPAEQAADQVAVAMAWGAARLWSGDAQAAGTHLASADRALAQAAPELRRIAEPTLAALRILHTAEQDLADPGLLTRGWALAGRCGADVRAQAEHRALGTLWFALAIASLRGWEIAGARHALRQADDHLGSGRMAALRCRARAWRALADASYGDLTRAGREADSLSKLAIPATGEASSLAALAFAEVCLQRDDIAMAKHLLSEADPGQMGRLPGEPPAATIVALAQARVMLAGGDATAGRAVLSRLRGAWAPGRVPLSRAVTVTEAEAALAVGDVGRARALLLLADEGADLSCPEIALAWADVRLVEGDYGAALTAVQPYLAALAAGQDTSGGEPAGPTIRERIRAMLVAAVARRRQGAAAAACDFLERSLDLAEPEGAYRVFLDGGAAVRAALTVLVPPTSRHAGFAGRVLERFDAQGMRLPSAGGPPRVRLTDSERAVLCFLPSHMTNEEISQALYLSINTVKTHLRSAYRKLGVGSRREAIAQGRRLGLL